MPFRVFIPRRFRACLLAAGFIGLAQVDSPAHSIVVRHDRDPRQFLELARDFPATVTLRRADSKDGFGDEGTLIAPNWVLTAAHVASDLGPQDIVEVQGMLHPIAHVVLHPQWHRDADMPVDIALVELAEPVMDVVPARIYSGSDELGMVVTLVGRGQTGNGLTGPTGEDRRVRAATNRVESTLDVFPGTQARGQYPAEGFQLRFTFDSPGSGAATDLEGISGGGDSGGPAYIRKEGLLYVIGVSSGQDSRPAKHKAGRYGVLEYYVRVSHFAPWIQGIVNSPETVKGAP
jgi:secreted trypsin-like serine protease